MFLIDLTFVQPLDIVDRYVPAHREYLASFYEKGVLMLGGRKKPRVGGVILSRHSTLEEVNAVFDADPLVAAGAARYSVIEFEPVMMAEELEGVL
ncbi:MAG TPA: YciI family protein [Paucimonas sp.]|nr:YciI family protein [Paucimonas sp.]